jgi:3-deoxy-D-manno-octulosonic-acid transferase
VALVNGRLSPGSTRRYGWAPALFEPCFRGLSFVSALDSQQAARFVAAGVPAERVIACASSKHGSLPPEPSWPGRPKLVLGSLHRGEERMLLPALVALRGRIPRLELVLAPRYPHRARRLVARLRRAGLPAELASMDRAAPVVVVDQMGDLAQHYRQARAAFVGGTLVPRGGHNVVEPAARGVPVLVGPYTQHCAVEVQRLVDADAASVFDEPARFGELAETLIRRPALAERRGRAARGVAVELATAADRIDRHLACLIDRDGRG